MSFIDRIIAKLAPYDCLGCGTEGALACASCLSSMSIMPERCYMCHQPTRGSLTCADCLTNGAGLFRVRIAAVYRDLSKDMLWRLKSGSAQEAARIMAKHMSRFLRDSRDLIIVPAPTSADRIRQRGYDQALLLARELARQTKLPYMNCLTRHGSAHQVGAGRDQRLTQLKDAFRVTKPQLMKGMHILLVDDVITTGATLEAAAGVLVAAGAMKIEALAFAQPLESKKPA